MQDVGLQRTRTGGVNGRENHREMVTPRDEPLSSWMVAYVRYWRAVFIIAGIVTAAYAAYRYLLAPLQVRAMATAVAPAKRNNPLDALVGGGALGGSDLGLEKLMKGGLSDVEGYNVLALMESNILYDSLASKYRLAELYGVERNDLGTLRRIVERKIKIVEDGNGPISVAVDDASAERAVNMANDVIAMTNAIAVDLNRREIRPIREYVEHRYAEARRRSDSLTEKLRLFIRSSNMYFPEQQMYMIGNARMRLEAQVAEQKTRIEMLGTMLGEKDPQMIKEVNILREMEKHAARFMEGKLGVSPGISLNQLPDNSIAYLRLRGDYEVNARTLVVLQPLFDNLTAEEEKALPVLNMLDSARVDAVDRADSPWWLPIVFVATAVLSLACCALRVSIGRIFSRYREYGDGFGDE